MASGSASVALLSVSDCAFSNSGISAMIRQKSSGSFIFIAKKRKDTRMIIGGVAECFFWQNFRRNSKIQKYKKTRKRISNKYQIVN
jgi:hypothetical protein